MIVDEQPNDIEDAILRVEGADVCVVENIDDHLLDQIKCLQIGFDGFLRFILIEIGKSIEMTVEGLLLDERVYALRAMTYHLN